MAKIKLSSRARVVYLLHINQGKWLSILDIKQLYQLQYKKNVSRRCIIQAIDENNFLNDNIELGLIRRYKSRRPIRHFAINPPYQALLF